MTTKLVRDELLRSHRYQTLSTDTAKLFFFHLLLASDGHSNAEVNTTILSAIMGRHITDEIAAKILGELADHDLIRPYQYDGKTYIHIPRSRQRIRHPSAKHPRPPKTVEDKQISELIAKARPRSGQHRPDPADVDVDVDVIKYEVRPPPVDNSTVQTWADFWIAKGKALGIKPQAGEQTGDYCRRVIEREKGS